MEIVAATGIVAGSCMFNDIRCSDGAIDAALAAFARARTVADYRRAKRIASKLDPVTQLAMVDSILAARDRVGLPRRRVAEDL